MNVLCVMGSIIGREEDHLLPFEILKPEYFWITIQDLINDLSPSFYSQRTILKIVIVFCRYIQSISS